MEAKMVGQKGNKPKKSRTVDKALVPPTVFSAVPLSATAPASSSQAGPSSVPGSAPGVRGPPAQDEFSDPESSLFDYQQMDEAGYASVGFGTWPNQGRRPKVNLSVMPQFRQSGYGGHYAEPAEVGLGDGASLHMTGNISDLYATPMKKKGKGPSSSRSLTGSRGRDEDGLNQTQQDVRAAMKQVHELPDAGETMLKTSNQRVQAATAYQDSGMGSLQHEEHLNGSTAATNSPEHDLVLIADRAKVSRSQKAVKGAMDSLNHLPGEDVSPRSGKGGFIDKEVVEALLQASEANTSRLVPSVSSARLSARSKTPRSDRGMASDMEVYQLKMHNEEMQGELHTLQKVAESIHDRDFESASTIYFRKEIEKMKEENETLRTSVHRLNVELSDYQAKYRPVDPELMKQAKELHGLPSKGPIPSWLISKRYLAPLFLAYDDHLEEKDAAIKELQDELSGIKSRVEEILKENQKLRMTGSAALAGMGSFNEWEQLQEQARLVLEENQILMEQLEVQNMKSKDLYTAHVAEISRLAKKLSLSEGEKADTERELESSHLKYRELKHKHDQVLMESGSNVNIQSHINSIADLKRTVTEEKEQQEKAMETFEIKLKASEEERKRQGMELIEMTAENRKLKAEVKAMARSVRQAQQKMSVLHKAVEMSENKEMITQEQLAQVIKVAEQTALERDTVYKVAKEQQQENHMTVNKMMNGSAAVGKLEEKLKLYRMKAQAKLSTVADRLKEQDEAFNTQKKEYERELHYLRLLVKEKEEIINSLEKSKKEVEEDLDTMWQAANSENHRIKTLLRSGSRKLKEHSHLSHALNEEIEYEEEMHFLESEGK